MDTAGPNVAPWVAEVAGLATSSTIYWEENGQDWLDSICRDDEPDESMSALAIADGWDDCSNEPNGSLALNDPLAQDLDASDYLQHFVVADIRSIGSVGLALYGLFNAGKEFFEEIMRHHYYGDMNYRDAVKTAAKTMTTPYNIKKAAGAVIKTSFTQSAIVIAVLDSAWSTLQYVTSNE